jgi:hypothetical protein
LGAAVGQKDVDERAVRPGFEAAEEHPMPSEHSELLPFPKAFRMVRTWQTLSCPAWRASDQALDQIGVDFQKSD